MGDADAFDQLIDEVEHKTLGALPGHGNEATLGGEREPPTVSGPWAVPIRPPVRRNVPGTPLSRGDAANRYS